ncbi:MAG: PstS family phosphate ABC transporter substrate-binding protein [Proteobacteria bacterium]|nr:PstS family phosphate ABC transporter substrate-binding protein [Pseudomonadota bacterium]
MKRILLAASVIALAATGAQARDQIRIVGSSTVYPFTTAVAEQFGKTGGKTPIVESTGTGGGMKLFCAGVGVDHPDATNASRAIKKSEFEDCQKNGVTDIIELEIGFDGLTMANSKKGPKFTLTKQQIFQALAKQVPGADGKLVDNPNKSWSDVDKALPNEPILVLGPPPTSGTRDSFVELVMEKGAEKFDSLAQLKKDDAKAFEVVWKSIREDGAYVEAGENDNLIVQKLEADPAAVGIFGFSFLEENSNQIQGANIEGADPTYENIASGTYKVARPLYVYIKKQHIGVVPGLDGFMAEYVSDKAIGEDGYLADKGLVTLPKDLLEKVRAAVTAGTPLTAENVK